MAFASWTLATCLGCRSISEMESSNLWCFFYLHALGVEHIGDIIQIHIIYW